MVTSENFSNFNLLRINILQTIIVIITGDKVTEIFCIIDNFCNVFGTMITKYTLKVSISVNIVVLISLLNMSSLKFYSFL